MSGYSIRIKLVLTIIIISMSLLSSVVVCILFPRSVVSAFFPLFLIIRVSCNFNLYVSFSITYISSTVHSHCFSVKGSALCHNFVIAFLLANSTTLTRYSFSFYIVSCVRFPKYVPYFGYLISYYINKPYFVPISFW